MLVLTFTPQNRNFTSSLVELDSTDGKGYMMSSEELGVELSPRGVITLAFGKQRYVDMGKSLGRSLMLNAPNLPRAVVTNSDDPELKELFTHVIPYQPDFGSNVRQKLHLDLYSPFEETLFIDSDCLVLNDLDSFWKAFSGQYFGVPGWRELRKGSTDPYLDVAFILDHFGIEALPKFNGGTYYFRHCKRATHFFDRARELLADSENLRFVQFRQDGPADEAILSVAMALEKLSATSMGTGGMWTPISSRGPLKLDVQHRFCSFEKEGQTVYPDIIHFAGEYASCFAYYRESIKLMRRFGSKLPSLVEMGKTYIKSAIWECSRSARNTAKRLVGARHSNSRAIVEPQ